MPFPSRPAHHWQLRSTALALGGSAPTRVMGILNCTPDSFSEGSAGEPARFVAECIERGLALLDSGADIVDVGGESTRPGSHAGTERAVSLEEEQRRVLPVIRGILAERPGALLSIDTYRAATANLAVAAGCQIVNDVSGLLWDAAMASTVAALGCGLVLTHTRGRPDEWRALPPLAPEEVLPMVREELQQRLGAAIAAGIAPEQIVLDPGYGFGKSFDANYPLLAQQAELLALGRPLLAAVSRKSFLGRTLAATRADGADAPPREREAATLAANTAAILAGASIIRVHDVRSAREAAAVADAVLAAGYPPSSAANHEA